ncbi:hypothetical protein PISMIDRAFT_115559 [Pisolithus microcarpus 441]|uniref:Uncharacterized protein n=1 Tax=Pisolithus microcarpus 441 TaxID=765257 RepID=A0A0C9YMQ1_9AGAM|nr:hypothetical protein PISMIDRAFT_115559 [Pisolithus microcarpus 441]
MALEPTETEWEHVQLLLSLLGHAKKAQHSFSMEQGPMLHTTLPALEALHKVGDFTAGLKASLNKISQYYDCTSSSDAHIMAMLLNPAQKLHHIHTYWGEALLAQGLEHAEEIVCLHSKFCMLC